MKVLVAIEVETAANAGWVAPGGFSEDAKRAALEDWAIAHARTAPSERFAVVLPGDAVRPIGDSVIFSDRDPASIAAAIDAVREAFAAQDRDERDAASPAEVEAAETESLAYRIERLEQRERERAAVTKALCERFDGWRAHVNIRFGSHWKYKCDLDKRVTETRDLLGAHTGNTAKNLRDADDAIRAVRMEMDLHRHQAAQRIDSLNGVFAGHVDRVNELRKGIAELQAQMRAIYDRIDRLVQYVPVPVGRNPVNSGPPNGLPR